MPPFITKYGWRPRPFSSLCDLQEAESCGRLKSLDGDETVLTGVPKCDFREPVCGPCGKSKRSCGYPKKHIFVLNDEGSHKTVYRKPADTSKPVKSHTNPTKNRTSLEISSNFDIFSDTATWQLIPRAVGAYAALKQQLLSDAYSKSIVQLGVQSIRSPWTLTLSAFAGSIHALNAGPLSCYTAWVGRQGRDPLLLEVSRRLYVEGLREVQGAVNDPVNALRDETLGACLALIVYEALECPDRSRSGYSFHVEGCSKLVKIRGASMHRDGVAHTLFCAFRNFGITKALEKHRSTYLASPAWTTLPWQIHPKSWYDRLLDLLALGPDILEKGDRLAHNAPHLFFPAVIEMIEELRAVDNKLQNFYVELLGSSTEDLYWEASAALTTSYADESGIALHFPDLETARVLTLYWAALSMVWAGMADLYTIVERLSSNSAVGDSVKQVLRGIALEPKHWLEPARKVCQSVEYCHSQGVPGVGPLMIAVPLDMVLSNMKNRPGCAKEYQEAMEVRKEISEKWLHLLEFSTPEGTNV